MKRSLQEHNERTNSSDHWPIMARIYANFNGLSTTLVRKGYSSSASKLAPFARGFTRAQPLFDFIDVGGEKEGVDYKIRGKFSNQLAGTFD